MLLSVTMFFFFCFLCCEKCFIVILLQVSPFHFECGTRCQVKLPFPVNFVGQSLKTVPSAHDDSPRFEFYTGILILSTFFCH